MQIGKWQLNDGATLSSGNESHQLTPKAYDLLVYLAERPGQLVTNNELVEVLWSHQYVSDTSVYKLISELRRALGDDPKAPIYIRTVSRRGYVLVAEVNDATVKSGGSFAIGGATSRWWYNRVTTAVSAILIITALLGSGFFYRTELLSALVLHEPRLFFGAPVEQKLGVATAPDGTRIAYATSGDGPPIVYVLTWLTHLQKGFNSPVYDNDNLVAMTSRNHQFVRYDGRGFGLSDRNVKDMSLDARVSDLKAVVDKLGLKRFGILAASAGGPTAIAFTARYPDRVTALVLASTFAYVGDMDPKYQEASKRALDLFEVAWQRPEVRTMFADQILQPTGDDVDKRVFARLLKRCCDGPTVARFFRINMDVDVRSQAKMITVPTLVIHARDDAAVPLPSGKQLAALIPDAQFEIVEGGHREGTASTTGVRRRALEFFASTEQRPTEDAKRSHRD